MGLGFRKLLAAGLACAAVVLALAGCSKKVVAPNSRPEPEGQKNGDLLMVGWHEQASVWFVVADPVTPENPGDDVIAVLGNDYWVDPAGVRATTLDVSRANAIEAFHTGADGNAEPLFDFLIPASVRLIGTGLDVYDFEDLAPAAAPQYFGRGAINGVVTDDSPVSNSASAFPTCDDNLNFLPQPKLAPGDSVFKLSFVDDPRAAFYVVEIGGSGAVLGNGQSFSLERRIRAIPGPVLPGLRAVTVGTFLMPGGTGLTGIHFTISTRFWPLFFYIRVTAFDNAGRMVNRVNDYLHTHNVGTGVNLETYEPFGGAVEILDPYPDFNNPVPTPSVLKRDAAFALLASLGGGAPARATKLSASAAGSDPAPVSPDQARAMRPVLENPLSTPNAVRLNIAAIRRAMEQAVAGASRH